MSLLNVYAGKKAHVRLLEEGFHPDLFTTLLGASGGPKWFVLAGIDRVLVSEFLHKTNNTVNFVGSSAGAFRFACLTQNAPTDAINRLSKHYSETVYSEKPTREEISEKAAKLMDLILPGDTKKEILTNPKFKANFIVARCKNLVSFEQKQLQALGLLYSAAANTVSRKLLDLFYERFLFCVDDIHFQFDDPYNLSTAKVKLTENNIHDALMASGAIPNVLMGIKNIKGAAEGMYRDGGVTDYHFDLAFGHNDELTLYPHFYNRPIPGWFDKLLTWRKPHAHCYDNVVMVVPDEEFISGLPYCKIPDRHDFTKMTPEQRIPYWQTVLSESDRLGEAFLGLQDKSNLIKHLKPLAFKTS